MHYEGDIYRPPSEADSLIVQATVGCSWNHCTYCAMYREKTFRAKELAVVLGDLRDAGRAMGRKVEKVFVADGDALALGMDAWDSILLECRRQFPALRRVSAYATAMNLLEKSPEELRRLRELGLALLYIGPESGDEETLKRIAKGAGFDAHVQAAQRARGAGMALSAIFLLGAGGVLRSREHALASGELATAMDPQYLSALTLTVVPGTPIEALQSKGLFELPDIHGLLRELALFIERCTPTDALFRTNHASNYLPLAGRLPQDKALLLDWIQRALDGRVRLRPEEWRGL